MKLEEFWRLSPLFSNPAIVVPPFLTTGVAGGAVFFIFWKKKRKENCEISEKAKILFGQIL